MYQVLTNIVIQQVADYIPPGGAPVTRDKTFTFNYLHSYESESSWESMSQTMKIVLPKNVKFKDQNGATYSLASNTGTPSSIGGYVGAPTTNTTPDIPGLNTPLVPSPANIPVPTFMRGDMITLNVGYRTKLMGKGQSEVTYMTGGPDPTGKYPTLTSTSNNIPPLFQGFITRVSPRLPFTLECEDAMYLLSLVPTPNKHYNTGNIQSIVSGIIQQAYQANDDGTDSLLTKYKKACNVNITLSTFSMSDLPFDVQSFISTRGNLKEFLMKAGQQYHLHSWFRGFELRVGPTYYLPDDAVTQSFAFKQNILDNDRLHFKRKDDIPLSVIVTAYASSSAGTTTKPIPPATSGKPVTTLANTQILVYSEAGQFKKIVKQKGVDFPANDVGKRFTLKRHTPVTDVDALFQWRVRFLKRYYYDGLEGSFTTFGVPYVKHGDIINLTNPSLPEMTGLYMCKAVTYSGSAEEGLRQEITLDFKINQISDINTFDN